MVFKIGSAASQPQDFFTGISNFLVGAKSGKIFGSKRGQEFLQVNTNTFDTSDINDIEYLTDLQSSVSTNSQTSIFNNIDTANTWTTVDSTFGITNINSILFDESRWLIAGNAGQMRSSTDGVTWTTVSTNFGTTNIRSISYGRGQWYILGENGEIRRSSDLSSSPSWTTVSPSPFGTTTINSSVFMNNQLTIVGNTGQMRKTTNGTNWTTITSNFGTTNIQSIAYGNGRWVAVGDAGQIRTSTDGTIATWTTDNANFGTTNIQSIAYGNNLWIAVGDNGEMRRTDFFGLTWTTVNSNFGTTRIKSIAYGNNLWIAIGDAGQARKSTDSINWTTINTNFGSTVLDSVLFANKEWLIVGDSGQSRISSQLFYSNPSKNFFAVGDTGKARKSTNGLSWSTINTSDSTDINIINYGGTNNISTDLTVWVTTSFKASASFSGKSISYGNGMFVMGISTADYSGILISSNGNDWFAGPQTAKGGDGGVDSIVYGNGIWIIGTNASGRILRSTDLTYWTSVHNLFNTVGGIGYGNGTWVIGNWLTPNQIRSSTNGISWTTANSNFGSTILRSVAYGNGIWLIGGAAGQMRTSTDTFTWTTVTSGFTVASQISEIVYGNGIWVAGSSAGAMRCSTNGISWTSSTNIGAVYALKYISENGLWIGSTGTTIYTSTDGIVWGNGRTITDPSAFIYDFATGKEIIVYASTNSNANQGPKYSLLYPKNSQLKIVSVE